MHFKTKGQVLYFLEISFFSLALLGLVFSFIFLMSGHQGVGNKLIFYAYRLLILGGLFYILLLFINEKN